MLLLKCKRYVMRYEDDINTSQTICRAALLKITCRTWNSIGHEFQSTLLLKLYSKVSVILSVTHHNQVCIENNFILANSLVLVQNGFIISFSSPIVKVHYQKLQQSNLLNSQDKRCASSCIVEGAESPTKYFTFIFLKKSTKESSATTSNPACAQAR